MTKEFDLTYGSPLRHFLENYFDDCGQQSIPYNHHFVHALQDIFFSTLLDLGEL